MSNDKSAAMAKSPQRKKARPCSLWRHKCIDAFQLRPLPESFLKGVDAGKLLEKLSEADDATWERYYRYRMKHGPEADKEAKKQKKKRVVVEDDDGDDYSISDDDSWEDWDDDRRAEDPNGALAYDVKMSLDMAIDEVLKENGANANGDKATLAQKEEGEKTERQKKEARKHLIDAWRQHAAVSVSNASFEDDGETLRNADYACVVFSPYALPRALTLRQSYYSRLHYSYSEFNVSWSHQLKAFDKEDAENTKEGRGGGKLASNDYLNEDGKETEKIVVTNLTAGTVKSIRDWLHGSAEPAGDILGNFDFLRLLFAACGSGTSFKTEKGDIGYSWRPSKEEMAKSKADDDDGMLHLSGISWLEHRCRLISGALRPVDRYYQPPSK